MQQAVALEPHAAPMGHVAQRLPQNQALGRLHAVDPPREGVAEDRLVVLRRVRTPQRENEPALAERVAVTGPHVAAGLGEHRHHLVLEAVGPLGFGKLDRDGHFERLPGGLDRDLHLPRLHRPDPAVLDGGDGLVAGFECGGGGEIESQALGRTALDDERVRPARVGELHRRGRDSQGAGSDQDNRVSRDRDRYAEGSHNERNSGRIDHRAAGACAPSFSILYAN